MIRVACYIDGFNVYHAIDDMSRATRGADNYLKWLDLRKLMDIFIDRAVHQIVAVKYFSAYATWMPGPYARHQLYVSALRNSSIAVVLGQFKEKDIHCKNCRTMFKGREEKESDVNLACHLISDAYRNTFDNAFIVTRDSDLAPPMRFLANHFPSKKVKVIAPPQRGHSKELWALADMRASVKREHLLRCLLPQVVVSGAGVPVCTRPLEYDPPP
jgi:uncharacterized LabA/DUF88 family protein